MTTTISIAKGLFSSYKNARDYTIPQALLELDKYTNNYEVLGELNRVYGDIDFKNFEGTEEQFNDVNNKTYRAIIDFIGDEKHSIMTASSYLHKKISWRFVFTNFKTTIPENKQWVKLNIDKLNLPTGVSFDTIPYGKNQKIRMLHSNKDGENRPLKLVVGEPIDTLISYIPDECKQIFVPTEKKAKKQKQQDVGEFMPTGTLERVVMNINNDENTDWEQWYKVAQAIFNENGTEELFMRWSAKSSKHDDRNASNQWGSLKRGEEGNCLTSKSLWYWSSLNKESHEQIVLECCPKDDYQYKKIIHEREFFKLKNPSCYVRLYEGKILTLKDAEMNLLFKNDLKFLHEWTADKGIRTYEELVFKPKQSTPKDKFNIFTNFKCKAIEGDISVMKDLMWLLSGKNEKQFEYVENYFAHMIQKPYEKPGIAIVFYSERQGAGKDTPLDKIGEMIGNEYFFNSGGGNAESDVFGRFTSHLQKTILLKMEEVDFETNKRNENALLSLITAPTKNYEAKGRDSIVLDDYKRIVMTTNKQVSINVREGERRLVLINSSEDRVGDREYWDNVHHKLKDPSVMEAYHYYLLTKDISNFNIRERPITDYYNDVKTSLRPYHATYFQHWICTNGEYNDEKELTATQWLSKINDTSKFQINPKRFGEDVKKYPKEAFTKKEGKLNNTYTLHVEAMKDYLVSKGWWVDV
jgi:hypothetical protein